MGHCSRYPAQKGVEGGKSEGGGTVTEGGGGKSGGITVPRVGTSRKKAKERMK